MWLRVPYQVERPCGGRIVWYRFCELFSLIVLIMSIHLRYKRLGRKRHTLLAIIILMLRSLVLAWRLDSYM
jgi:hypothetical protein